MITPFASTRSESQSALNMVRVFISGRRSMRVLLLFVKTLFHLFRIFQLHFVLKDHFSSLFLKLILTRPRRLLSLLGSRVAAITCTFKETSSPNARMSSFALCKRSSTSKSGIPLAITVRLVQSSEFVMLKFLIEPLSLTVCVHCSILY